MRIFLNGFMGSGKSTTGKQLANELNYFFVDLDNFIEEKTFSKINSLFKQFGEAHFRSLENEYLKDLAVYENIVIACGGGTISSVENEKWMNKNGKTIFLNTDFKTIFKRLNNENEIEKRPLLKQMEKENFEKQLSDLYNSRILFYNKCAIKINAQQNIVSAIIEKLQ